MALVVDGGPRYWSCLITGIKELGKVVRVGGLGGLGWTSVQAGQSPALRVAVRTKWRMYQNSMKLAAEKSANGGALWVRLIDEYCGGHDVLSRTLLTNAQLHGRTSCKRLEFEVR